MATTGRRIRKVRNLKVRSAKPDDPIYSTGFVIGVHSPSQKPDAAPDDTDEKKQKDRLPHQYPWLD